MDKEKLSFLRDFCTIIENSKSSIEIFELILDIFSCIVDFKYATIFAFDYEKDSIHDLFIRGQKVELIDTVKFNTGSGLSAWVAKKQKPVILTSIHTSSFLEHLMVKSFISIPSVIGGELPVVLNFGHSIPEKFNQEDFQNLIDAENELNPIIHTILKYHYLQFFSRKASLLLDRINNPDRDELDYDTKLTNKLFNRIQTILEKPSVNIQMDYLETIKITLRMNDYWLDKLIELKNITINIQDLFVDIGELSEERNIVIPSKLK